MCADAAEAAYAGALNQLSEALTAAVTPLNQLTASLTSQLAVCPYILNVAQAVQPAVTSSTLHDTDQTQLSSLPCRLYPCSECAHSMHNCHSAAAHIKPVWCDKQGVDGPATTEPHFGSHAAAAAAAQLSQWLATQLSSLSGSSQGLSTPSLKSAVQDLQQRLSVSVDLEIQGLCAATAKLHSCFICTQLSVMLAFCVL